MKELARTGNKKNNKKNSSSSSKTNNKNNKTTKKTNTNKKPVRKNYKNEKEYKKALDAWNKKNNWATTSKSTLKKTQYTSKPSKPTGNYIPMIKSNSDNSQPFSEFVSYTPSNPKVAIKATNDLAITKSKGEDYQELEARYIFSGKKNPLKPTTHGLKKNSTMEEHPESDDGYLRPGSTVYGNLNYNELPKGISKVNSNISLVGGKTINDLVADIHDAVMLPPTTEKSTVGIFSKYRTYYNRFKIPDYNIPLQKGFAHVFFVRPSCNILKSNGKLVDGLDNHPLFTYALNNTPGLLGELCMANSENKDNQFMMSLSNFVSSFSLNDEYINTDTYGKTYTGYKVTYGKHDVESKTAGSIDINFNDDSGFHIYQLIRLWVKYISGVYRGEFSPRNDDVFNKVLDYTGAIYYIITAEDGETILFWSKYYGVFPSTIPASQYAWGEGNQIQPQQLTVTFNYSFKEDYNPYSILEYNYNSKIESSGGKIETIPVYDYKLGHSSWKWGQKPFIQLVKGNPGNPYVYKLRYTKKN